MNRSALTLALLSLACLLPLSGPASADPPIPENAWVTCKPVETMIFLGTRFHVKCDQGWTNPSTNHEYPYLAISASNSSQVEQAILMVQTALLSGKRVKMLIKTSASSNPSGCLTNDCRAFTAIGVVN